MSDSNFIEDTKNDPEFQKLSSPQKLKIISNYFTREVDADPEFKAASAADPELRTRVWNNMYNDLTGKPKELVTPEEIAAAETQGATQDVGKNIMKNLPIRPVLEYGGMAAGGLLGAAGGTALMGPVFGPSVGGVGGAGFGYGAGKATADYIEGVDQPKSVKEGLLKSIKDVGTGAAMEAGGAVVGKGLEYGIGKVFSKDASQVIQGGMDKGIKPSTAGKTNLAAIEKYNERANVAVNTILENKKNLQLTNEYGEVVDGLPQNLRQFSEAVDQTKKSIFNQYDSLSKKAGSQGVVVEVKPVVDELNKVINNKALEITSPSTITYAKSMKDRIGGEYSGFTPENVQTLIKSFNERLEAYYKNPSLKELSTAKVDALVVNNLRKNLDDAIEGATGVGYQELKNKYGALRTIENDVNRRVVADAKRNTKGLIDLTDIFSAGELASGILTGDPVKISKAATQFGLKTLYKWRNDPNNIIKGMFKNLEKDNPGNNKIITPASKVVSYLGTPRNLLFPQYDGNVGP